MEFFEEDVPHNYCNECKKKFADSFELIDHVLEDDEDFDPYYLMPSGLKLMLGSLLRYMYHNADEPDKVKHITQSTYVTLFAAEMGYDLVGELIEDMVVKSELHNFEAELEKLLTKDNDGEQGGA